VAIFLENRGKELQQNEALVAVNGYPKHIVDKVLINNIDTNHNGYGGQKSEGVKDQLQRKYRKYDLSVVHSTSTNLTAC
jgi:hypothetical protein